MTELLARSENTFDQVTALGTVSAPTTAAELRLADQRTAQALTHELRARALRTVALPTVPVGPFAVADATRKEVVDRLVEAFQLRRRFVAYALHVGGLLERRDELFVAAMAHADLVYADGVSIVSLAAAAGAERIERAATTDIGEDLLARVSADPERRPRVALLGGPEGLARRAAEALEERYDLEVVFTTHGYHDSWDAALDALRASGADVVVVGLGAPREMRWVHSHRERLPHSLVLTCGGWFGFLAGEENRAPLLVQRLKAEWLWRWVQQPRRLAHRYLFGALVCARLSVALQARAAGRRWARPAEAATR